MVFSFSVEKIPCWQQSEVFQQDQRVSNRTTKPPQHQDSSRLGCSIRILMWNSPLQKRLITPADVGLWWNKTTKKSFSAASRFWQIQGAKRLWDRGWPQALELHALLTTSLRADERSSHMVLCAEQRTLKVDNWAGVSFHALSIIPSKDLIYFVPLCAPWWQQYLGHRAKGRHVASLCGHGRWDRLGPFLELQAQFTATEHSILFSFTSQSHGTNWRPLSQTEIGL